jgi:hypothetical protein
MSEKTKDRWSVAFALLILAAMMWALYELKH